MEKHINKMFSFKKGNFADVGFFIALSLVFVFLVVMVYILLSRFNSVIATIPMINSTVEATTISNTLVNSYPKAFDYIMPLIYVFFIGFTVWSAGLVESTNKFFVIGIVVTFLLTMFSLMIENLWDEFKNNANILPYITSFPITTFMLDYLRYFVLLFCFIILIMLYSRRE